MVLHRITHMHGCGSSFQTDVTGKCFFLFYLVLNCLLSHEHVRHSRDGWASPPAVLPHAKFRSCQGAIKFLPMSQLSKLHMIDGFWQQWILHLWHFEEHGFLHIAGQWPQALSLLQSWVISFSSNVIKWTVKKSIATVSGGLTGMLTMMQHKSFDCMLACSEEN